MFRNHHEALVSHEDFEAANAMLDQHAREKGNDGSDKYQNRYAFTGKIICGECGATYRRRIHYPNSRGRYVAWLCNTHLKDIDRCSAEFIRDTSIKAAFVTMMNKLTFGREKVLKPLAEALKNQSNKANLLELDGISQKIDENLQQRQVLTQLLTKGLIDPAVYTKENNQLVQAASELSAQQERLSQSINNGMAETESLDELLRYTSKKKMLSEFDPEFFEKFVDKVVIRNRSEAEFHLRCGLLLTERMM